MDAKNPPTCLRVSTPRSAYRGRFLLLLWLLAPVLSAFPSLGASESLSSGQGAELLYLVGKLDQDGFPVITAAKVVPVPSPPTSDTHEVFDQGRQELLSNDRIVAVEVVGSGGAVVFRRLVKVTTAVRGEFPRDDASPGSGSLQRVDVPLASPVFVIRTPYIEGSNLRIEGRRGITVLPVKSILASKIDARSRNVLATRDQGAASLPDNRVDILIMGDGYTAAEEQKFFSDADATLQGFLSITPYDEYSNYLRIEKLFTPSAQSGADHPPYSSNCPPGSLTCCSDPAALNDPFTGQFRQTAFDSRFCFGGIHRLLVPDLQKVSAAAAGSWDKILLMVNDTEYGGSGSVDVATISLDEQVIDLALHEWGHTFTDLADEYDAPNPGFPACSDSGTGGTPPCETNVTDQSSPSLIKWSPWIPPGVPIPTPEGSPLYQDVIGLFEGARYETTGMYRPSDNCLMNELGHPFDDVCVQSYVLRLYQGGWGEPNLGISTIEPGLQEPTEPSFRKCQGDVVLSVETLAPQAGPAPSIEWLVGGQGISGANTEAFTYSSNTLGEESVAARVKDSTSLVHPTMAGSALTSEHSWSIDTVTMPASLVIDNETISSARVEEACETITAGPAVTVTSAGSLTLRAGEAIELQGGALRVELGGQLAVRVGPVFPPE